MTINTHYDYHRHEAAIAARKAALFAASLVFWAACFVFLYWFANN